MGQKEWKRFEIEQEWKRIGRNLYLSPDTCARREFPAVYLVVTKWQEKNSPDHLILEQQFEKR